MSTMSQFFGGGGGAGFKLAPDLTWPSVAGLTASRTVGIDASGGLTDALSLTGKWAVSHLKFDSLTSETITIKLTIDGVVIWNSTFVPGTNISLLTRAFEVTGSGPTETALCSSSFLLQVETASDTSIILRYTARPIL